MGAARAISTRSTVTSIRRPTVEPCRCAPGVPFIFCIWIPNDNKWTQLAISFFISVFYFESSWDLQPAIYEACLYLPAVCASVDNAHHMEARTSTKIRIWALRLLSETLGWFQNRQREACWQILRDEGDWGGGTRKRQEKFAAWCYLIFGVFLLMQQVKPPPPPPPRPKS